MPFVIAMTIGTALRCARRFSRITPARPSWLQLASLSPPPCLVIGRGFTSHSPNSSATWDALGAFTWKVMRRSGWTSGERREGG